MKNRSIFFLSLVALLIFISCNNFHSNDSNSEAKGNRVYGGTLCINETDPYQTLYPTAITDVVSAHIAGQIYEGLVKFNPKDLSIIPSLAEKWDVDADGKNYTFHLKKGVMFQDNDCFPDGKGREVKAADFKYSFELLCTNTKDNSNFAATFKNCIVGANTFFETSEGKANGNVEGIKVIDDYTLKISLTSPHNTFLYTLTSPAACVVAKEAVAKYGKNMHLGTGPFMFVENSMSDKVILVKNKNYHRTDSCGNKLPFLDSVIYRFISTKQEELDYFKEDKLSMVIGLPAESIKDMVETQIANFKDKPPKYLLERSPEMVSQYYEFNLTKEPFNNLKVRQAFSYAIDRNKIIEQVLKGEAYGPGINGICPPTFKGYDISKIKGYEYDAEKAQKLLAEAGYAKGKGFPKVKIELNSGGNRNTSVVAEIQKQIKDVLNVDIDFEVVSQKQKLEDEEYARSEMFRSAWVADFPSPENFLWIVYGGTVPNDINQPSYPNSSRYKNSEFDKLFEAGKAAKTEEESFDNFMKAEQILMNDAPIMVLYYEENYRLIKSNVRNFYSNPMLYNDYSEVYLKDFTQVDVEKQKQKR